MGTPCREARTSSVAAYGMPDKLILLETESLMRNLKLGWSLLSTAEIAGW